MKRFLFGLLSVGLIGVLSIIVGVSAVYAQNPDNFKISSFEADYYLARDNENRSTLKTVERITAVFPQTDQNHGLERALPQKYDGHSTNLKIESIADENGNQLSYSDKSSNDNLVIRIGDADTYVHDEKTYVITYTQKDVTRFFADTNADEFYWDVNGTGWSQAIDALQARIHISSSLTETLNGDASCYYGREGSTTRCAISREMEDNGVVFNIATNNLGPNENATFAIGFKPNVFAAYQPSWQERLWGLIVSIWIALLIFGSVAALATLIWVSVRYNRLMKRAKGREIIIPEYLPPKGVSVLVGAHILGNTTSDITAQLIDLAVRHYIKIYQTKEKTMFKSAEYELEIVKPIDDLSKEEQQLLKDLFGNSKTTPGSRFAMAALRKKYAISAKLTAGRAAVQKSARGEYALYEHAEAESRLFKKIGYILLILGVITVSPVVFIVSVIIFIFMSLCWPLTQKGAELRDYLKGLQQYITVAEADRLQMLQSPEGAEKIGEQLHGDDSAKLVKLYERVLPYAVLFGIEKEWTKQLGAYYEAAGQQPDWYAGNGAFNALVFTSALNNFSTQSSLYSSSTSSTSGGSSGGGSSGGGGGGGGGGGW